jgi:hypothetical protein
LLASKKALTGGPNFVMYYLTQQIGTQLNGDHVVF